MACFYENMPLVSFVFVALVTWNGLGHASELTFELPDNEKLCFHEIIDRGVKCTLEFQVITGGNYDVDLELMAPGNRVLYKDMKKQYDTFTWTTDVQGEHKFCFSNEFSTFTHKLVYFDFQVGDDDPIRKAVGDHATVLTQTDGNVFVCGARKSQDSYRLSDTSPVT